jgi:uncharacterized protein (DUF427 family)
LTSTRAALSHTLSKAILAKETAMPDGNPAPGFARQPDRIMDYTQAGKRVRVIFDGQTIADTQAAIALQEADYPVGYYFPKADVRMDLLRRTDHSSHCPFKGDASYWTLETAGKNAENAVWSYETPFDEAEVIKEYVSFYGSKVDAIEVG